MHVSSWSANIFTNVNVSSFSKFVKADALSRFPFFRKQKAWTKETWHLTVQPTIFFLSYNQPYSAAHSRNSPVTPLHFLLCSSFEIYVIGIPDVIFIKREGVVLSVERKIGYPRIHWGDYILINLLLEIVFKSCLFEMFFSQNEQKSIVSSYD